MANRRTHRKLAWRLMRAALWAALLLAHAPGFLATWTRALHAGQSIELLRTLLVTLTETLFILKLLDVRWLRIPRNPRVWIALAVGVALLHAGLIPDGWQPLLNEALDWQSFLVLVGLVLAGGAVSRAVRTIDVARLRAWRASWRDLLRRALDRPLTQLLPPRFTLLLARTVTDRAPPR